MAAGPNHTACHGLARRSRTARIILPTGSPIVAHRRATPAVPSDPLVREAVPGAVGRGKADSAGEV
jgi:hypothetical protein